jgi:DNA-binding winged helix-turn-helix (wHTH) protein
MPFPPVQQRMLELLSDGLPHSKEELHDCLYDELSNIATIQKHISLIRKQLRPHGQDILIEFIRRRVHYRHVRLLSKPR